MYNAVAYVSSKGGFMKIKIFIIICFFTVSSVFAQNWFLGTSVALNFSTEEMSSYDGSTSSWDSTRVNISPTIGYRINKFDFGVSLIYQFWEAETRHSSASENFSIHNTNNLGIGIGLFSRYNFFSVGNFSILGRLGVEYLYTTSIGFSTFPSQPARDVEEISHRISINLRPIFEYKLSTRFSVFTDFGIRGIGGGFRHTYWSESLDSQDKRSRRSNSFSFDIPAIFNVNITAFSLGFHVHF